MSPAVALHDATAAEIEHTGNRFMAGVKTHRAAITSAEAELRRLQREFGQRFGSGTEGYPRLQRSLANPATPAERDITRGEPRRKRDVHHDPSSSTSGRDGGRD